MKRGKVSDTILDRSVFKLLGRRGNTSKPAYGQDAAHIVRDGIRLQLLQQEVWLYIGQLIT
mgnify:CR=1 FL=1